MVIAVQTETRWNFGLSANEEFPFGYFIKAGLPRAILARAETHLKSAGMVLNANYV